MAHKVDSDGNVAGAFFDGDFDTGDEPTQLGAKWHNMIQDEINNVVVTGGGLTLDDEDNTQLLQALVAMIAAGAAGPHVTQIGELKEFLVEGAWDDTFYKKPNGQTLLRATYPALWALVSAPSANLAVDGADQTANRAKWGPGDGATTFEMPDLRGLFGRQDDEGATGGIAPAFGLIKDNQNAAHTHDVPLGENEIDGTNKFSGGHGTAGGTGHTESQGGDEACPDHTPVIKVMRVK